MQMITIFGEMREDALDFVGLIPTFKVAGTQHFRIWFDEPEVTHKPSPIYLSTFLMLTAWIKRQGWVAAVLVKARNPTRDYPTPNTQLEMLALDCHELLDELNWDIFLDGGIAIGKGVSGKLTLIDTLILNGTDEISIIGSQEKAAKLLAILKDWIDCVVPFFAASEEESKSVRAVPPVHH